MQRDIPPELLPVIGERSSVCRSAQPGQPSTNNKNTPAATTETEVSNDSGGGGDDGFTEISNNNKNSKTAEACTTVVELLPEAVDPGSSPDEDWDDAHTSVRVDFHIFFKAEEGVCLDENDDSTSSDNDDTDAKVTSDLKTGNICSLGIQV